MHPSLFTYDLKNNNKTDTNISTTQLKKLYFVNVVLTLNLPFPLGNGSDNGYQCSKE